MSISNMQTNYAPALIVIGLGVAIITVCTAYTDFRPSYSSQKLWRQ